MPAIRNGLFGYVLLFIVIGLYSCGSAIMLVYGMHQPGYRTDNAVINYAQRIGLEEEIYRLRNFSKANHRQYSYIGHSIPDVLLFNASGQLTRFDIDCSGSLDSIVRLSLPDIGKMQVAEQSLRDFYNHTYQPGKVTNAERTGGSPVYVVKFAEYAGLLNKDHVPALIQQLRLRDDVEYMVLNVDYSVK